MGITGQKRILNGLLLAVMAALVACSPDTKDSDTKPDPSTSTKTYQDGPQRGSIDISPHPVDLTGDTTGQSSAIPVVNLLMYQMSVPSGIISRNKDFWKHLDEDSVDVAAHELLYKNGIRVGRGHLDEWPFFKAILDQDTAYCRQTLIKGMSGQEVQINMTEPMAQQTLFVFTDKAEPLSGRMFDECIDQFTIAFQWAPRKKDTLRVKLCPDVLAVRKWTNFSLHDEGDENSATKPEQIYDLRLVADIAPGEFLLIAPSPSADDPNRVGNRFLIQDKAVERYEQVLVLCQQRVSFDKARPPVPSSTASSRPTN